MEYITIKNILGLMVLITFIPISFCFIMEITEKEDLIKKE